MRASNMLLPLLLSDVNDATSRRRIRDGRGPSIAWELGHLLEYRCELLKLLGVERNRPFPVDFTASGATEGDDYPTTAELRAAWAQLQSELTNAFEAASEESVRGMSKVSGSPMELQPSTRSLDSSGTRPTTWERSSLFEYPLACRG
jgi:hypothetical protein